MIDIAPAEETTGKAYRRNFISACREGRQRQRPVDQLANEMLATNQRMEPDICRS